MSEMSEPSEPLLGPHMLDLEATTADAESAEEATVKSKARAVVMAQIKSEKITFKVNLGAAALGWFRAQKMHDRYWLGRALQESATKSKQHNMYATTQAKFAQRNGKKVLQHLHQALTSSEKFKERI